MRINHCINICINTLELHQIRMVAAPFFLPGIDGEGVYRKVPGRSSESPE